MNVAVLLGDRRIEFVQSSFPYAGVLLLRDQPAATARNYGGGAQARPDE
jgi:hypothetical protein